MKTVPNTTRLYTPTQATKQASAKSSSRAISNLVSIAILSVSPFVHSALLPGDLIISEVMANPAAVSDTYGEWFEIFNASTKTIDLNGLEISDDGSNNHTLNADNPLLFGPGDYFVLGRNLDTTLNGGVMLNYSYSNFTLSNSADAIRLSFNNTVITELSYSAGSDFGTSGQSMAYTLSGYSLTSAEFIYGLGDIGTPGTGNLDPANVPEVPVPASAWLFASALGMLLRNRRKSIKA